jgi:hypothetical protein
MSFCITLELKLHERKTATGNASKLQEEKISELKNFTPENKKLRPRDYKSESKLTKKNMLIEDLLITSTR